MKVFSSLAVASILALLVSVAHAQPHPKGFEAFGENYQFVVFAVLEGAYNEGITQQEIDQILMRGEDGKGYMHFIYACPICTASKFGFQLYSQRPELVGYKPIGFKVNNATFGEGVEDDVHSRLMSDDVKVRLTALHGLVSKWIDARVEKMNLSITEEVELFEGINAGRKRGMEMLKGFKKDPESLKRNAPGYIDLDSCAMCDAACKLDFGAKD